MSKYRLTVLTPVHISSGEAYAMNYNLLHRDGYIYIYDEFKLVEYFLAQDIAIPSNLTELNRLMASKSDAILDSNLHIRKIESSFTGFDKPMLENISTDGIPIVAGSSIKGSLRTAVLDCLNSEGSACSEMQKLLKNDKNFKDRLIDKGKTPYDNDLAEIFKFLKVSDSIFPLDTKIYKTINMKKDKTHQSGRGKKVEEIANYVEAIKPGQTFDIEIEDMHEDKIFKDLSSMCNNFYIPFFEQDQNYYFSKKIDTPNISNNMFIINVGRFGGAESKSINGLRHIQASKADEKSTTSARTFSLESNVDDTIYYENALVPFGWIMCEKIENDDSKHIYVAKNRIEVLKQRKFNAIDHLLNLKSKKELEAKEKALQKQKEAEEAKRKAAEEEARHQAELAAMSPLERKIEELKQENPNPNESIDILIYNALKNGELDAFKCDALNLLRKEMQKLKKWVEKSKKPEKDKKYKRTIEVIKMLEECS